MKTQTRFTPGPYLIADDKRFVYSLNEDGLKQPRICFQICQGYVSKHKRTTEDEVEATAELIASAPDLYAALDGIVAFWDKLTEEDALNDLHAEARAVLRKARGES